MSPLAVARVLAAAGAVVGLVLVLFFLDGFEQRWRIPLGLWAGAPLPFAFRRVAGTSPQLAHLLPDLHSQALGMWTYWDAFLGPSSRDESQAGLIVLFAPLYQLARLGLTVLLACLLDRPRYPQNL
jgi:hypothetical protein